MLDREWSEGERRHIRKPQTERTTKGNSSNPYRAQGQVRNQRTQIPKFFVSETPGNAHPRSFPSSKKTPDSPGKVTVMRYEPKEMHVYRR